MPYSTAIVINCQLFEYLLNQVCTAAGFFCMCMCLPKPYEPCMYNEA